jgi:hypothetical protein
VQVLADHSDRVRHDEVVERDHDTATEVIANVHTAVGVIRSATTAGSGATGAANALTAPR